MATATSPGLQITFRGERTSLPPIMATPWVKIHTLKITMAMTP